MADIGIYSFVAESVGRKGGLHTDSVKKKKNETMPNWIVQYCIIGLSFFCRDICVEHFIRKPV